MQIDNYFDTFIVKIVNEPCEITKKEVTLQ